MRTCWYICSVLLFLVGAGLIAAGLVVIYKIIPDTVHDETVKEKPLGYNNESFNDITTAWMNPTYNSHIQYWFYDYMNVDDILNRGAKPAVRERGPYGYREIMANANVSFFNDGTVSYQTYKTYIFDPSVSCATCSPDDLVTVPDLTFFVFIDFILDDMEVLLNRVLNPIGLGSLAEMIAKVMEKVLSETIGYVLTLSDTTPFTTQPVKAILFDGYKDHLFTKLLPGINTVLKTLFYLVCEPLEHYLSIKCPDLGDFVPTDLNGTGLFVGINGTGTGMYYIKTGQGDVDSVGQIVRFDAIPGGTMGSDGDMLSRKWWDNPNTTACPSEYNEAARMINGTGGDFFKPFITRDDRLFLYVSDICRSMYLVYDQDITQMGIDGFRFVLPRQLFDSSKTENCGFCHTPTHQFYSQQSPGCLPSGLLDVGHCQPVEIVPNLPIFPPIVVSNPHFLYAEDFIISSIGRFTPSIDSDQTYIDIEPTTGTILTAQKRLQINVMVHNYAKSYPLNQIQSGAYPLVWINETFIIDQQSRDDLYDALIAPQKTGKLLGWIAVGVGVLLIIISLAICVAGRTCAKKSSSHKSNPTSYSVHPTPNDNYVSSQNNGTSDDRWK